MRKKLRSLLVRFIARAVAEDYRANGVTRRVLLDEERVSDAEQR